MNFYKIVSTCIGLVDRILFRVEVVGKENIPKEGACILACNHKSNWDPLLIAGLLRDREIHGLAKKELFKNKLLSSILEKLYVIPVDRNNPEIKTLKSVLKILKNEEVVGIFPEGTRHKEEGSFAEPKPGLGMFAIKGKSDIVPITIVGDYKIFRKMIIYIDKPMRFDDYYDRKNTIEDYTKVTNSVMDIIKNNYFKLRN